MKANLSLPTWAMVIVSGVAIYLCVSGVLWWVWRTVLTYFWPTGPEQVINPEFFMFVLGNFLMVMVARTFVPRR